MLMLLEALRRRLTLANVLSAIALVTALGGTGYAATALPADSVGTDQIRARAVTGAKLAPGAVTGARIANGAISTEQMGTGAVTFTAFPTACSGASCGGRSRVPRGRPAPLVRVPRASGTPPPATAPLPAPSSTSLRSG